MADRRAPVQASRAGDLGIRDDKPAGSVAWWEHEAAWRDYASRYPGQSAETIADRCGFSYAELIDHLGHEPTTWVPRHA